VDVGALYEDAHGVLARLRATEPVSWVPALEGWLVTGYDESVAVMRDSRGLAVETRGCLRPGRRATACSRWTVPSTRSTGHLSWRRFRPAQVPARFGDEVRRLACWPRVQVLGMGTWETLRTAQESSDGSARDGPVAG
jgi:hypothetical protein